MARSGSRPQVVDQTLMKFGVKEMKAEGEAARRDARRWTITDSLATKSTECAQHLSDREQHHTEVSCLWGYALGALEDIVECGKTQVMRKLSDRCFPTCLGCHSNFGLK